MVIARQKVNAEHVNWHRMDFSLPWTIQATNFDLITFNLVLEHVEDLRHVFTEARKRLVQGGHVHVSELHPFKQYLGTKPRFEAEGGTQELDVFTHHISDFSFAATETGFDIVALNEWFDENRSEVPRLLTLLAVAR